MNEILIFIDFDNLTQTQQQDIRKVVMNVLEKTRSATDENRLSCRVRLYGGWYERDTMTQRAQDINAQILRNFPELIRIENHGIQATVELACSLIQEPDHLIFNTFRRKSVPSNIRTESQEMLGCNDSDCFRTLIKKTLKKGRCPKLDCDKMILYRSEQKLVDTMLACDLVFAARSLDYRIILISDDDDFIPPLRSAVVMGCSPIRIHPKPSRREDSNYTNFEEMELEQ